MAKAKQQSSVTAGNGFDLTKKPAPKALTQTRLAPLDLKPIVTPKQPKQARASTASGSSKPIFTQLPLAWKNKAPPARSSTSSMPRSSTSDRKGKGKENAARSKLVVDREDSGSSSEPEVIEVVKYLQPKDRYSRLIASATPTIPDKKPKRTSLGREIINPSTYQRGPTIEFDGDEEPPFGEDEMVDEPARRKRNRVQEGGRGRLCLVPEGDHDGFGTGSGRPSKRARSLEMEPQSEEAEAEEEELEVAPLPEPSPSAPEPDTVEDSGPFHNYGRFQQPPPPPYVPPPETLDNTSTLRRNSFADSSQDDEDHQSLHFRIEATVDPESENESEDDRRSGKAVARYLTPGLDAAGPDDSGFAEYVDDHKDNAMDEESDGETVEDSQMLPGSIIEAASPRKILSGLLKPSPTLPKYQFRQPTSSSSPPAQSSPNTSPAKSVGIDFTNLPDHGYSKTGRILVPETQTQAQVFAVSAATRSPLEPAHTTSQPQIDLSQSKSTERNRALAVAAFKGIAPAWEGQHVEPPPKPVARQSNLSEFFKVPPPPEESQGDVVVEDSQFGVPMTLEEAALAAEVSRVSGWKAINAVTTEKLGNIPEGDDEEEDIFDPDQVVDADRTASFPAATTFAREEESQLFYFDDDAIIPTSDPEDGPFSPLGTPERLRSPSPLENPSPGQPEIPREETQWESYWTVASPPPEWPIDEEEFLEPLEEVYFEPPEGWEEERELMPRVL
ncbi:hypothetical protein P7C70_g49, partial [Phenoliferia sp. Uapishka_3]